MLLLHVQNIGRYRVVILSGAKDLTHEAWSTHRFEGIPSLCERSLVSLGMTEFMQIRFA